MHFSRRTARLRGKFLYFIASRGYLELHLRFYGIGLQAWTTVD